MSDENLPKEVSAAQLQANRANSLKSTGPKTKLGKRNSSRNALRHGLSAKALVVEQAGEKRRDFVKLFNSLKSELEPVGALESHLVSVIAVSVWRSYRALRAEKGEIVNEFIRDSELELSPTNEHLHLPSTDALTKLLRYERANYRQGREALRLLQDLQRERRRAEPKDNKEVDVKP